MANAKEELWRPMDTQVEWLYRAWLQRQDADTYGKDVRRPLTFIGHKDLLNDDVYTLLYRDDTDEDGGIATLLVTADWKGRLLAIDQYLDGSITHVWSRRDGWYVDTPQGIKSEGEGGEQ